VRKDNEKVELQAIRFAASKFTVAQAKKWLKDHDYTSYTFEPATGKGSDMPGTTKVVAAKLAFVGEVKAEDEDGVLLVTISTRSVDRDGDIIEPAGIDFTSYLKNPIVPWAHDTRAVPVAKALSLSVIGERVEAKVKFADYEFARLVYRLYKDGFLNAWSVGIHMKEYEPRKDDQGTPLRGVHITKSELLEFSAVPVPANPEALTQREIPGEHRARFLMHASPALVKALGEEDDWHFEGLQIVKAFECECIECGYAMTSEEHCNTIKCPQCGGTMRRASRPGPGQASAKGVIPFKHYPLAPEGTAWSAGREVRAADVADLKLMCAWYDSAEPDVKGSYKLPHHRQSDKHTIWRAVAAGMGALLGARGGVKLPAGDRKGVYNHLVKHYKEFDKTPPEFKEYTAEDHEQRYSLDGEVEFTPVDGEEAVVLRASAFKKSLSERGATGKIPISLEFVDKKEGSLSILYEVLQSKETDVGVEVTEARILRIKLSVPAPAPETTPTSQLTTPDEGKDTRPEPRSNEIHRNLEHDLAVLGADMLDLE